MRDCALVNDGGEVYAEVKPVSEFPLDVAQQILKPVVMVTSSSWVRGRATPGVTGATGGGRWTSPNDGGLAAQGRVGASPSRQRSSRIRCRPHQQIGVVASQGMGHGVVDGVHGEAELGLMQRVGWRNTRHLPPPFAPGVSALQNTDRMAGTRH